MSESQSHGRTGRPKDPAKRAAIVTAASQLFAVQTYETVTMEIVAARAGVSKMTVYSHFTDKETLFETVVSAISDQMTAVMIEPGQKDMSLGDHLTKIGITFLTAISDPAFRTIQLSLPLAIHWNQVLAQRFYNAGPGRTQAALASVIATAVEAGELATDSPILAAEDLLGLWERGLSVQLMFGLIEPIMPEEIRRRAERGTRVFLSAYAPSHSPVHES